MRPDRKTLGWILVVSIAWVSMFSFRGQLYGAYSRGRQQLGRVLSFTASQASNEARRAQTLQALAPLPLAFSDRLRSMYDREPQMGTDGKKHEMTPSDGIPIQDGIYIYELCKRVRPARTLEVGFAEGYSTLFFLAAASINGTGSHFAIRFF